MCIINSNFDTDWQIVSRTETAMIYNANFTLVAFGINGNGSAKVTRTLSKNLFENNMVHVSIESLSIKDELEKLGNSATGRYATGVGISHLGQVEKKIKVDLSNILETQINKMA